MSAVLGVTAVVLAVAMILWVLRHPGPVVVVPAGPVPVPDDYPTTPIPVIPPAPALVAPEMRLMLRRDELLWAKSDPDDPEGVVTLGLLPEAGGQLCVLVDDNGIATGLRLDRHEVQGLRDAITGFLVATSKPVRP